MVLSVPEVKALALPAVLAALLAAPGCVDIIGADLNKYVERDEKHFAVSRQARRGAGHLRRLD